MAISPQDIYNAFSVTPFESIALCFASLAAPQKHVTHFEETELPDEPESIEDAFRQDWINIGMDMRKAIEKVTKDVRQ